MTSSRLWLNAGLTQASSKPGLFLPKGLIAGTRAAAPAAKPMPVKNFRREDTEGFFIGNIPGGQSFSSMWLLMLLPGLFLGLGSFVVTLIEYLKSEVVLTDEHLRFKVGWLSLGSTEIMLSKIETITLFEPLIGRLAGYGTVAVTGTGGTAFHLRFLPDSKHLHSLLQTMVNQAQTGQAPRYSSPTPSPSSNETRYMPKG